MTPCFACGCGESWSGFDNKKLMGLDIIFVRPLFFDGCTLSPIFLVDVIAFLLPFIKKNFCCLLLLDKL
jgi:hypothetical protein